jgi:hypothetical protein
VTTLTHGVHLGHTVVHAPVPGFQPMATCCGQCTWHTEDHAHARALAVQHAATAVHRVVFEDATVTQEVLPS